jgi:hypothetical protein
MAVYTIIKRKNKEYFESSSSSTETFNHTLHQNKDIEIVDIIKYINYDNTKVAGHIGQNILYKIYSKLKNKKYNILRYPDFRNEIKRHSLSYFKDYFDYLRNTIIIKNENYIFDFTGFHGIIDNKVRIWIKLMNKYGRKTANNIMGITYLIPNDKHLFINNYVNGNKYILKNSYGGGRGSLKITNNKEEILHYFNSIHNDPTKCEDAVCHGEVKYNIVQNYIEPTFLVNDLKFGLRMFLIIICNGDSYDTHVYKDGYCYYSIDKYNKNSVDLNSNVVGAIAQTDITRKKYNLPESYLDFKKYVNKNYDDGGKKLSNFENNLVDYSNKITNSNKDDICIFDDIKNSRKFGIYAMDIEIDRDFTPVIFEANWYFTRFNMNKKLGYMMSNMYNDIYYKLGLSRKEVNGML